MTNNDELLGEMIGGLDHFAGALQRFKANQNEDSDEINESLIEESEQALENLRGHVEDLVP